MTTLSIDRLFGSGAIIQAGPSVTIWGKGVPGSPVSLQFAANQSKGIVDSQGRWRVDVTPPEIGGPYELTVTSGQAQVTSESIMVGDVWICAGQSNMEWPFANLPSLVHLREEESPRVRFLRADGDWSNEALKELEKGEWSGTSGREAGPCSAIGYGFARYLQEHLNDRPIGLVVNAIGGSLIEAWIPQSELLPSPEWQRRAPLRDEPWSTMVDHNRMKREWAERWFDGYESSTLPNEIFPKPPSHDNTWFCTGNQPGALFNTLVTPLAGLACSGVIWYQGESNCDVPQDYANLYALMVKTWRETLGQPELPFYHVQLASWEPEVEALAGLSGIPRSDGWPGLRQAQADCRAIPHTGMATAIDTGHRYDIHPPNKEPVAERLARVALKRHYHLNINDSGPELDSASLTEQGVQVRTTQDGDLHTADGSKLVLGFMVRCGEQWSQVPGRIVSNDVVGQHILLDIQAADEVAYASCSWQELNLQGRDGLPMLPGRIQLS